MANTYVPNFLEKARMIYDTSFLAKYNYLSSIYAYVLPNNIKEVFKWVSFIIANVPKVDSALDKLSSVSITTINYFSKDLSELDTSTNNTWKNILESNLRIKITLKEIGYNLLAYGNVFISVNEPRVRSFECHLCHSVNHENAFVSKNIRVRAKIENEKLVFYGVCPSCGQETVFSYKDTPLPDPERLHIIMWPVNRIDLYEDEITGEKYYYYTPEPVNKELIEKGNYEKIFKLPVEIIEASLKNTKIKFLNDKILHLRDKKFIGSNSSWGIPKLISAIPDMISLLLLRKSNERIYTDMIMPLRGLTPRQPDNGEPLYNHLGANNIKSKIEAIIKSWKKDPTSIKFFPIPLEPITMFGEGKALELSGEIDKYSTMILSSLGVPIEFIEGGLSYSGSGASLRVLQNQLLEISNAMEEAANFIVKKVAKILNKDEIRVKLIPLKLIDDASDKQNILAMQQMGKISTHTALNFFDLNYKEEQQRILEEQKDQIRQQLEIQNYQQQLATSLEDKIKQESMMENSNAWNLNQTAIIQEADNYVQQLSQLDYGLRKSKLDELAKENPVLYAVVKWRMEFMEQKQKTEAANANKQQ